MSSDALSDTELANQTSGWIREVVSVWRGRYGKSSRQVQDKAAKSLSVLLPPMQVEAFVRRSDRAPVEASLLVLRRHPALPDLDIRVSMVDDDGARNPDSGGSTVYRQRLEDFWRNMVSNWTAGRAPDAHTPYLRTGKLASDQPIPLLVWTVPGRLCEINVEEFVEEAFKGAVRTRPTPPRSRPSPTEQHIYDLGMDREASATSRWLDLSGHRLFAEFGFGIPWWCGINLARADLFQEGMDGDVDIMAGPLQWDLTEEEWRERIDAQARRCSLTTARSNVIDYAVLRAAAEGKIKWPPDLGFLVACEVKASRFQPEDGIWRSTHTGEGIRVKGQLQLLLDRGIDNVAFLHLGATKPKEGPAINPYLQAAGDAADAEDQFPRVYNPPSLPLSGYFTSTLGAVDFALENESGAGGVIRVLQDCRPNPVGPQPWRAKLSEHLTKLPQPTVPCFFILPCPRCGAWRPVTRPFAVVCPSCSQQPTE
ncbi:MAG: hypothetical protein O7H41_20830 [Planctomycetota bacterium]|nr:hypothetical protein [Planctomycetota bacterium]